MEFYRMQPADIGPLGVQRLDRHDTGMSMRGVLEVSFAYTLILVSALTTGILLQVVFLLPLTVPS